MHLRLVGTAPTGHAILHLVGGELDDITTEGRRFGQCEPTGLPHAHGGAHVGLEEHLLDRHCERPVLLQQQHQLALQLGQPRGQRIGGRSADDTERDGPYGVAGRVQHRVTTTRETRVDSQHHGFIAYEHAYEASG